jgi:hypothetical protein
MTWALRRTPSGRPAHVFRPTMLRKLGLRNGSGSGSISLPLSVNSFSMINNAGVPFAGTSSTTDLKPATRPLQHDEATAAVTDRRTDRTAHRMILSDPDACPVDPSRGPTVTQGLEDAQIAAQGSSR